jgi:hypothetical protein
VREKVSKETEIRMKMEKDKKQEKRAAKTI